MKRALLPFAFIAPLLMSAQTVILSENFDSHADGDLVAQTIGLPWTTWSNAPGGTEDTPISDEQASSGTLSMKVSTTVLGGGPTDMVLRLGDRTTGSYGLTWKMYIPTGQGGYFNLQHDETPGMQWAVEVYLPTGGTAYIYAAGDSTEMAYPHDAWFDVTLAIDLTTMQAVMSIDGGTPRIWAFNTQASGGAGMNQIGGINFFSYAGGADPTTYYIDDLAFVDVGGVGMAENAVTELGMYPNPTRDLLTVELPAGSTNAVASLVDATGRTVIEGRSFQQNANVSRTQMDLQGLPEGVYFLRVQNGADELVRRVTKL